jgi:hypothetical protein
MPLRIIHTVSPVISHGDARTDIFELKDGSQSIDLSTVSLTFVRYYYGDGNLAYEFSSNSSGMQVSGSSIECSLTSAETNNFESKDITKLVFVVDGNELTYYKRLWIEPQPEQPQSSGPVFNRVANSGRIYCYPDNRWITDSDDNYGRSYYQFAESGGSGVDPIIEWEHQGLLLEAGCTINKLLFSGMSNSAELLDLEIVAVLKKPNPITRWQTGMDNDNEDAHSIIYRNFFWNNTETEQPAFSGNSNDLHLREIDIPAELGLVTEPSMLCLYFKPVGVFLVNRYFRANYTWLLT